MEISAALFGNGFIKKRGSITFKTLYWKRDLIALLLPFCQIVNGRLQYKFDCGSGSGVVSVHSAQVSDGEWHSVSLEVDGNHATLVLDRVHTASGTAPGTLRTLNLDNIVYFGGHVRQHAAARHGRSVPVASGLRGCMEAIVLNGQELPLNTRARRGHAVLEDMVDVSPGCALAPVDSCSSNPCTNGGTCNSLLNGGRTHVHCEENIRVIISFSQVVCYSIFINCNNLSVYHSSKKGLKSQFNPLLISLPVFHRLLLQMSRLLHGLSLRGDSEPVRLQPLPVRRDVCPSCRRLLLPVQRAVLWTKVQTATVPLWTVRLHRPHQWLRSSSIVELE